MSKFLRYFLGLILLVAVGYISLNLFVLSKINSALKELSEKENFTYGDFQFNILNPQPILKHVHFENEGGKYIAEKVEVSDLSYSAYAFGKTIKIGKLKVESPEFHLQKNDSTARNKDKKLTKFDQRIKIDEIWIKNASLNLTENDLTCLALQNYEVKLQKIQIDENSLQQKIPFKYNTYELKGGKLTYLLSKLQSLTLDSIELDANRVLVHRFKILPNYSREKYIEVIPHEMDLMDLSVESIALKNYKLELDSIYDRIWIPKLDVENMDFEIYRDKTIADDLTEKKMYSNMLRDLPFGINIDTLNLKKAYLSYEEVQEKTGETGQVFFTELSMNATSLTNIDMESEDFPETVVNFDTQFMGKAPLQVEWTFKVNDPQDHFTIKGEGKRIPPEQLNRFFKPAFNMNAEGDDISNLYFDFYGDRKIAQGEFFMVYDKLKVEVLKKEEEERNKFVTFFANLLIKKQNKAKENEPVGVSDVERDPTRSFWNYFWNCIFAGLKKTLI